MDEASVILQLYPTTSAADIAQRIGTTAESVRRMAAELGCKHNHSWSRQDEAELLDYLRTHTYGQAAIKYGLSIGNVKARAQRARRRLECV